MKKLSLVEIINKINYLYNSNNCKIVGGFPSHLTNGSLHNLFNYIVRNNKLLSTSAGISNDEMSMIFNISKYINPKNILIIGNSYGISTIFFSLLFPSANIVAIDKYRVKGIEFTNNILKQINKKHLAIKGDSPKDIKNIAFKYFSNKIDLVLIDGLHTNKAQTNDFNAISSYLTSNSLVILHDVINCKMIESYNHIKKKYKYNNYLITKSSSGMAFIFKQKKINKSLKDFLEYYSSSLEDIQKVSKIQKKLVTTKINKKYLNKFKRFIIPKHPQK